MQTRCPHCRQQVEVAENDPLVEIPCPSCGSHFSLIDLSTASFAAKKRRIGHFELLHELGQGAFGSVWKARDLELDRMVAIKLPRREQLDEIEAERFLREARAAAQLRHPGIVSIYEVGREGRQIYIVSDFVESATLGEWARYKPLTFHATAEVVAAVADALRHAHERGVIHRDIKPGNILVDGSGRPHLTDFGLAKREAGELTMTVEGQILGTPAYMSPEQASGEGHRVDARSDIYSLGVVLFHLLTGELPFRGNQRMLLMQIIHDEPPTPRKFNSHIPKDLETITLRCLAKQPSQRYETAADLARDLRRYVEGEAIRARPISRVERAWRWCQRRPAVAMLTAAVVVLLVLLAVIATRPVLAGLAIAVALSLTLAAIVAMGAAIRLGRLAERERSARREAEANFRVARTAVEEMLTEVGQQRLSDIPQMEPVRKTMLKKALRFYEQFVADHPTDPTVRRENALAHHRLADIYAMLGEQQEAEQSYRQSIRILQQLIDEQPDDPEHAHYLAVSFDYLAELFRTTGNKLDEAETAYRRSLEISQWLAEKSPDAPRHQQEVARAFNNLGILLSDTGRPDEAEDCFRQSVQRLKNLAGQHPHQRAFREELARSHINLAVLLKKDPQQVDAAEEEFAQAAGLLEKLVSEDADSRDYRYKLAVCRLDLGNLMIRDAQRYSEAEANYRRARDTLDELSSAFPSIPQYREELANCYHCLASVLALRGQLEQAEEAEREAVGQYEKLASQYPSVVRYRSLVAIAWGGMGWMAFRQGDRQHAEKCVESAIRHQQSAVESLPDNPDYRFRLREHYAFMAEMLVDRGDHERAVRALAESVHRGVQTLDRLRSSAFEPLSSRDDFTQLIAQLETTSNNSPRNTSLASSGGSTER